MLVTLLYVYVAARTLFLVRHCPCACRVLSVLALLVGGEKLYRHFRSFGLQDGT